LFAYIDIDVTGCNVGYVPHREQHLYVRDQPADAASTKSGLMFMFDSDLT